MSTVIGPMEFAVYIGDLETVKRLIVSYDLSNVKAHIDAYNLLRDAVARKHSEIVELLLAYGTKVNLDVQSVQTPLHIASTNGDAKIVKMFLDRSADPNAKDYSGRTPLDCAVEVGSLEVTKLLLSKSYFVDGLSNLNIWALRTAVQLGYVDIVEELVRHEAVGNRCRCVISTVLEEVAIQGDLKMIEHFLKSRPQQDICFIRLVLRSHGGDEMYRDITDMLIRYNGFTVNTLLHTAVADGNSETVEHLLLNGADANVRAQTEWGFITPLFTAMRAWTVQVAQILINHGADVNEIVAQEPLVLHAIRNVYSDFTKLLLANGATIKYCPNILHIAVAIETEEIVEAILQRVSDSDINSIDQYGRTAFHYTSLNEGNRFSNIYLGGDFPNLKGKLAELLLRRGANVDATFDNGTTILHAAVRRGYVRVVEALLRYSVDVNSVNADGATPLHCCAMNGSGKICKMLLKHGAEVDARQNDGRTALYIASKRGFVKVVKKLLKRGAEVDRTFGDERTSLHAASKHGHWRIIRALLGYLADVDARDKYGKTALHIASEFKHPRAVQVLLFSGADVSLKSRKNLTAFDYLSLDGHSEQSDDNDSDEITSYKNFDPLSGNGTVVAQVLNRHVFKMKVLNVNTISEQLKLREEHEIIYDVFKYEIEGIKKQTVGDAEISLYDILTTKDLNRMAIYAKNKSTMKVLESSNCKIMYINYYRLIDSNLRRGKKRRHMLSPSVDSFNSLLGYVLPDLLTMKIFSYLDNPDLRNLIKACSAIARS